MRPDSSPFVALMTKITRYKLAVTLRAGQSWLDKPNTAWEATVEYTALDSVSTATVEVRGPTLFDALNRAVAMVELAIQPSVKPIAEVFTHVDGPLDPATPPDDAAPDSEGKRFDDLYSDPKLPTD